MPVTRRLCTGECTTVHGQQATPIFACATAHNRWICTAVLKAHRHNMNQLDSDCLTIIVWPPDDCLLATNHLLK
jgi:hypothetical protein